MNNPIILEQGYNTSGLYAFLTSMFYSRSDSVNKILNMDGEDIGVSYVQEFLKEDIIGRFQMNRSIAIRNVNRFRNLLFNFGWRRDCRHDLDKLLSDTDPFDVYRFLFIKGMQNRLNFERVAPKENRVDEVSFDAIEIGSEDLVFSDSENPVINLSSSIRRWIQRNIVEPDSHNYSYRFKELPYLIPVFIDPKINDTVEKNRVPIDIKEAIGFQSLNDPVQKIFTWDVQSIILYDDDTSEFYSLIKNDGGGWERLCQSELPANRMIDMSDIDTINRIGRQIRGVFYKIK
jgi:hypothetical protein